MAEYPELDELMRAAFTETIMLLDAEAGLDADFEQGIPYIAFCRWCSNEETRRLKKQVRRISMQVLANVCDRCDKIASDLYLPKDIEEG